MSEKKRIIFTGGGSGGHVVPALTLIDNLKEDYEVMYIGSKTGIESKLTSGKVDKYFPISTGKLRRYMSIENFVDIFKILLGLVQSIYILASLKRKNLVVFSMGGFVSVPVVIAARLLFIKIIIHEQTSRVGLANKIASKFAEKVFVSFSDSLKYFPSDKVELSGYPVRKQFYTQELSILEYQGIKLNNLQRPLLFVTGGGNGSFLLNEKIIENLSWITEKYTVIHQVGKKYITKYLEYKNEYYLPVEFVGAEMPDLFKTASIVLSRSGAGTVAELMALEKKSIFIPLKIAQKNEQYHNAMAANKAYGSLVLTEDEFKTKDLKSIFDDFYSENLDIKKAIKAKCPTALISDYISTFY